MSSIKMFKKDPHFYTLWVFEHDLSLHNTRYNSSIKKEHKIVRKKVSLAKFTNFLTRLNYLNE